MLAKIANVLGAKGAAQPKILARAKAPAAKKAAAKKKAKRTKV